MVETPFPMILQKIAHSRQIKKYVRPYAIAQITSSGIFLLSMKTFWAVLGAILVAALIIVGIKTLYNQTEKTGVADENFKKEMARADNMIRVYKSVYGSPSPSRNLRQTVTPAPSPSPSLELPQ